MSVLRVPDEAIHSRYAQKMIRARLASTFWVVALLLAGCGGGKKEDFDSFAGTLQMSRLQKGEDYTYREMKPDFAVRTKSNSFNSVWKKLFGAAAPKVELNGKAALFALRGLQQSTGDQIRIRGAEVKGDVMEIKVKLLKISGKKGQCSPFDVVLVDAPDSVKSFKFIDVDSGKLLEDAKAY